MRAHAKINLYLDVISRYADGYHEIESVMQSVSLFDLVEISPAEDITVSCSKEELCGQDNLAYKAARLLHDTQGLESGAAISIIKRIPVAAGLAGGSADAAATLAGLNVLWGLHLPLEKLQEIGAKIGADIPFCLAGGTMLAQGKGEILTKLSPVPQMTFVLVTPPLHVSTAEIYRAVDEEKPAPLHSIEEFQGAIASGDINKIAASFSNLLETVAIKRYPAISRVKQLLLDAGSIAVLMSGSGPSVFAVCANEAQAQEIAGIIRRREPSFFTDVVKPVSSGIEVLQVC